MIDVEAITDLQQETMRRWHHRPIDNPYRGFLQFVCREHQVNYCLRHEHEALRGIDATDAQLAALQRTIDALNGQRNEFIEQLDYYLLSELCNAHVEPAPDAGLNTETPGSAIDRLSILAVRIEPLRQRVAVAAVAGRPCEKGEALLQVLRQQHADLTLSLGELFEDLSCGRKRLKVYRQFKPSADVLASPYRYDVEGRPAA